MSAKYTVYSRSLQSCKLHKRHIYLRSIPSLTLYNIHIIIIKAKLYRVVSIIWIQLCIQLRSRCSSLSGKICNGKKKQNSVFTLNYLVCNGLYAIFTWRNLAEWDICWGKSGWTVFYSFTLCLIFNII